MEFRDKLIIDDDCKAERAEEKLNAGGNALELTAENETNASMCTIEAEPRSPEKNSGDGTIVNIKTEPESPENSGDVPDVKAEPTENSDNGHQVNIKTEPFEGENMDTSEMKSELKIEAMETDQLMEKSEKMSVGLENVDISESRARIESKFVNIKEQAVLTSSKQIDVKSYRIDGIGRTTMKFESTDIEQTVKLSGDITENAENNKQEVEKMKISANVIRNFATSKMFSTNTSRINNIDFSSDGKSLIASSDDDTICVYDLVKGELSRRSNSKKYGADLVHFTHAANTAIHCSTKLDDALRYLSLCDNKYIRFYRGHTKKVTSISMSPSHDIVVSCGLDGTMRMWDLRCQDCVAIAHLPENTKCVASFDPSGKAIGIGVDSSTINLVDVRTYEKGPFMIFKLKPDKDCDWTGLKFSPDGKSILVSTNFQTNHLIDSFTGDPLRSFDGHINHGGLPLESSFSPDSQFVFCGSTNGRLHVWDTASGIKAMELVTDHTKPIQCVKFNPKFMMLATACSHLSLWTPCDSDDEEDED